MTDIVYVPGQDLAVEVAKRVKTTLMECAELQVSMPGFSIDLTGKKELQFPEVGVDFRTVNITGHSGDYHPQVYSPDGLVAKLLFNQAQAGTVTVGGYTRYSSFVVGRVEDLSFDLFTYFGDPNAAKKQVRHVPIVVPVLDMTRTIKRRFAGDCEVAEVKGSICIYGGTDQGSLATVKLEAAKLYRWMRAYRFRFSQNGLTSMQFELPKYEVYQDKLYEASIEFSCVVTLERATATPITDPTISLPPVPDTATVWDGGTF